MLKLRARFFDLLESHDGRDPAARTCDAFLLVLILANAVAMALESEQHLADAYGPYFFAFEAFSVAVFTVEYGLRVWVSREHPKFAGDRPWRGRLRYMMSPLAVIDLLAILPFYLSTFLPLDLRVLRLFRMLRILKLARYSPALGTIASVIRNESRAITGALCILVVIVVISSTLLYFLEREIQPKVFGSIPDAMWWAMATLTTVGYGDAVPVTTAGRIIGSVVMVLGIGIFVLWTSIFASGFMEETRKRNFVVTWKLVAQVPVFSGLDASRIAEIAGLLTPEVVPARHSVIRRGEAGDCMYFIVSGEVEIDLPHTVVRLGHGNFFGELALLQHTERMATVTTITECQLLRLDNDDFERLMDNEPRLKDDITRLAMERARRAAAT